MKPEPHGTHWRNVGAGYSDCLGPATQNSATCGLLIGHRENTYPNGHAPDGFAPLWYLRANAVTADIT